MTKFFTRLRKKYLAWVYRLKLKRERRRIDMIVNIVNLVRPYLQQSIEVEIIALASQKDARGVNRPMPTPSPTEITRALETVSEYERDLLFLFMTRGDPGTQLGPRTHEVAKAMATVVVGRVPGGATLYGKQIVEPLRFPQ